MQGGRTGPALRRTISLPAPTNDPHPADRANQEAPWLHVSRDTTGATARLLKDFYRLSVPETARSAEPKARPRPKALTLLTRQLCATIKCVHVLLG